MIRKLFYTFIGFGFLIGASYFYFTGNNLKNNSRYCPFCDEKILNQQKFYEDDQIMALYTHKPIFPAHFLIIPKRHVERFEMLTDDENAHIGRVVKKVDEIATKVFKTSSYLLLQKNGVEVGQTVPHIHIHYIARKKGDDSLLKFLAKMLVNRFKQPISDAELQRMVEELKD